MNKRLLTVSEDTIIRIDKLVYKISKNKPIPGDLILDRRDGLYAFCDMVADNWVSIKYGDCAEIGVPIKSVYKLVIIPDPINSLN